MSREVLEEMHFLNRTFIAVEAKSYGSDSCEGCAFASNIVACVSHPSTCGPDDRPNGQRIIWLLKEQS